ncbi:MAG: chloride channel protein [Candidatus Wallbacteria bacterium HGW-Wallbacteria-1]|jgi:CIC family chloride channel protein|uniref:Chloride channel protein n=1 Tax=Candidatus Wallbacteria bacterium HGW-Wallbacteria-1 TaxID=2013854 RepID=A0A2N1PLA0_9BACT|nr:MAG: chloride channel protein [Candidatus Wallbacteria bacterium HGW-Wallbacteria-1]
MNRETAAVNPRTIETNLESNVQKQIRKEYVSLFVYAMIVGVAGGFCSLLFKDMIAFIQSFLIGYGGEEILPHVKALVWWKLILFPTLGGLVVGLIIYFFAREAKGHGVPEVMNAVARKGGRIRGRVVGVKAVASALTIATGGSTGREGPIVQISSALASVVGQWLNLPERQLRTLVACGAAAGIAATFNAPIAGAIFALEIIIGELRVAHFSAIVVSSFMATLISRHFLGNHPAFSLPKYKLPHLIDYPILLVMAVGIGILAWLYIKVLYSAEEFFDNWKGVPEWIKPAIGGVIMGFLLLKFPQVYGGGYDTITHILANELPAVLVGGLVFLKLIATSITLGSGGSGGVFAPALFIGAAAGCAFANLCNHFMPGIVDSAPLYSVAAMAAFVGAATHAPIQAILIIFEMTSDYGAMLPLMICTVTATMVAIGLNRESIYTMKLKLMGINIFAGPHEETLSREKVADYMEQGIETLPADTTVNQLKQMMKTSRFFYYPVLRPNGTLRGIVTLTQIHALLLEENPAPTDKVLDHIVPREIFTIVPNAPLERAINVMDMKDIDSLVVVAADESENAGKPLGIIRRLNIISALREIHMKESIQNK